LSFFTDFAVIALVLVPLAGRTNPELYSVENLSGQNDYHNKKRPTSQVPAVIHESLLMLRYLRHRVFCPHRFPEWSKHHLPNHGLQQLAGGFGPSGAKDRLAGEIISSCDGPQLRHQHIGANAKGSMTGESSLIGSAAANLSSRAFIKTRCAS